MPISAPPTITQRLFIFSIPYHGILGAVPYESKIATVQIQQLRFPKNTALRRAGSGLAASPDLRRSVRSNADLALDKDRAASAYADADV
ncbi:MAG: hypothetical protein Q4A66_11840, partial [Eubacteriales bacterium]|nr:hypothetical protein [Eubacteriales bacterium]